MVNELTHRLKTMNAPNVVKIGSSSITNADGHLDTPPMNALVDAIVAARASGKDVVVVSSGAVAAHTVVAAPC